jgi:hypothetical protein
MLNYQRVNNADWDWVQNKLNRVCVCHNIYVGFWQSNWIESFPSDLHVQAYTDHSLLYYFVSIHASRSHKQTQGLETIFIPNH